MLLQKTIETNLEPRPFYVSGHNPNTITEVMNALNAGANAIEPDVNVYEDDPSQLCISHNEGDSSAPTLEQFLRDLHALAVHDGPGRNLSLVLFDCKPKASTPEFGLILLTAIRKFLTYDTGINIILSVADFSQAAVFDQIKHQLGEREGLSIDEEDDPIAVSGLFTQVSVANQAYGNGISIALSSITAPEVPPSMERACAYRAATDQTKFVYAWTVNDRELMQEYIRIGVDALITDEVKDLVQLVNQNRSVIRMANRHDNPLRPANCAYSLTIHTGDVRMAGTDANLTFTLHGTNGSASVTVDTRLRFRMERDDWNYVTLQSPDLGDIRSITVQRDDQGKAPGWFLDTILVESFRYGVSKLATFNCWIDSTAPFTQSFS